MSQDIPPVPVVATGIERFARGGMPEFPERGENIGVLLASTEVGGVEFSCATRDGNVNVVLGGVDAEELRARIASGEKLFLRARSTSLS